MSTWTPDELARVGRAEELRISSTRPDGTDRPFVIIWTVRAGDGLYVRSAAGVDNPWFRRAVRAGLGRIQAGGTDRPVTFSRIDADDRTTQAAVDAAYHGKYDHYGPRIVGSVVGATAHNATLRIDPR